MKRRISGFLAAAGALCALERAQAAPVEFNLNPQTSQVLLCEQGSILNFVPRVFLAGKVNIDFLGVPPIPATGTADISVPLMDLSGKGDPAQAGNAFLVQSLDFQAPAVGVTETSAGFVQAVDGAADGLTIDQFAFSLSGDVSLDLDPPNPPLTFPIAELFNESTPETGAVDFNGTIAALTGGGDCDLAGICTFSNDRPNNIPDLTMPCNPATLCQAGDLCLDVQLQNTPLGDVDLKVKIILAATNSSPAQGVLGIRQAAGLGNAPIPLDVVPCGALDGQVTQADALALFQAAVGDSNSPLPCPP